ncbi:MAG: hypothetical protein ACM3JI_02350 [Anaerolineae bacterium]
MRLDSINMLNKTSSFSFAELVINKYGTLKGGAIVAGISLTGIGGVALFVDHLYQKFFANNFSAIVQNFCKAEAKWQVLAAKHRGSSLERQPFVKTKMLMLRSDLNFRIASLISRNNLKKREVQQLHKNALTFVETKLKENNIKSPQKTTKTLKTSLNIHYRNQDMNPLGYLTYSKLYLAAVYLHILEDKEVLL